MDSASLVELGPGSLIGSYRILHEIARGGMSTVFEAVHRVLPRRAAVKVMHPELLRQPGMATRMVQEAAILEEVRHPGIVRVYECNLLEDHRPWIAMELVEGETLAARLHDLGVLSPVEVATLLVDVTDVLASVHARGIVHRDLKPDNLLLTPYDRDYPLRVIDWGVARLGPRGRVTVDGLTPGTPIYMSPEQATGKHIAAPCDIYSLGVVAYEALAGNPPFDGRTLAEVVCMHLTSEPEPLEERTGAPPELCDLVHRMLDKRPSRRPGAVEVRQVARAILRDLTPASDLVEAARAAAERGSRAITGAPNLPNAQAEVEPPPAVRIRRPRGPQVPSDEVVVIDPEVLELGVTELLPVVRKPRWTPEIGQVPELAAHAQRLRARSPSQAPHRVEEPAPEAVAFDKRRSQ